MIAHLRHTDSGSTHWLGDDGYPACWHDHRKCAEDRVARLEGALRDVYSIIIVVARPRDGNADHQKINKACRTIHAALTNLGK